MLKLAADADFNGRVLRALLRKLPDLDVARVQDAGLSDAPDPAVLEWAAAEGRILVTHDRQTMVAFAIERVAADRTMPGLFVIRNRADQIGQMVEDLTLPILCSEQHEWTGRVEFLPL